LIGAGFWIVATHPIKAEMSVAQPKHQAKEPIDLDIIIVCRKQPATAGSEHGSPDPVQDAVSESKSQIRRLNSVGKRLSKNDVRIILMSQIVKRLTWTSRAATTDGLLRVQSAVEAIVSVLHEGQDPSRSSPEQLSLNLE
jgi:adenine-specific DNA methylase